MFSLLNLSFGEQQEQALQDYTEASVMLRYNSQTQKLMVASYISIYDIVVIDTAADTVAIVIILQS